MPTSAYAPGSAVANGAYAWTILPIAPPVMAPIYNEGAKMPPALPEVYDTIVATSFIAASSVSVFNTRPPFRAWSTYS
jgi:hypothetical protein